jgi:hypothetical protein
MSEAIVFTLIVSLGLAWWMFEHRERPARYRRRPLLTGGGMDFLHCLRRALPECTICPQVAATALLEPMGMGRTRKSALGRIAGRRVGFAVFDEGMQLLVVIELDHRPRLTRREAECEAYFLEAGIRTLRFHPRRLPSEAKIRIGVFPRLRPDSASFSERSSNVEEGAIDFHPRSTPWRNTINAHS